MAEQRLTTMSLFAPVDFHASCFAVLRFPCSRAGAEIRSNQGACSSSAVFEVDIRLVFAVRRQKEGLSSNLDGSSQHTPRQNTKYWWSDLT